MDRSWEYINRSQTHECGNWDRGHAIPFLRIHKWDLRCNAGYSEVMEHSEDRSKPMHHQTFHTITY